MDQLGHRPAAGSARPTRARTSEIEVTFTPQAPERTLVELEHRNLDRHGDGWENVRGAVGSPGGWPGGLGLFAARLAKR